ncbi:MAG: metalloregulator ArsR/SmtB family transcription factor [Candidatus Izemoplasma sp.]
MVNVFKALGDENRLRIISILIEGKVCVCEIERILALSQSNVSRHLTKLKLADLIKSTKKAQWIYYEINNDFFEKNEPLLELLNVLFKNKIIYIEDKIKLKEYKLKETRDGICIR